MYNKYDKYKANDKDAICNSRSYGKIKGNYCMSSKLLTKICLDKEDQQNYAMIEKKTEYYRLMFDFDFKENKEFIEPYLEKSDKILEYIIKNINKTLRKIFDLSDEHLQYVYAGKNKGKGVHLYYYNITVNNQIHLYIRRKLMEELEKDNKYPKNILNEIIDESVCKANSIRLFYCYKDGGYYFPSIEKSTLEIEKDPEKHFKYCFINTNKSESNLKLKIDEQDIINSIYGIKKETKNKAKSKETTDNIEKITDVGFLDLGEKKNVIYELMDILNISRINKYTDWVLLVYLCHNYGLHDEIITISKKSPKFNNQAINSINKIFKNNNKPAKPITLGTLIKWATEDNFTEAIKILEKYNIILNLNIKSTDEILLCKHKTKCNYKENSKYISSDFIEKALELISHNTNVFIIQSPTGSGKTTFINKILESLEVKKDVLSVVSRRSMIATHQNAFTIKLQSYLDTKTNLTNYITSLEYLQFLKKTDYRILILDEINSLINHFYSDTMNGRRLDSLYKLIAVIKNADIVLCCDANITETVFKLFENLNCDYYYYRNTYKNKENVKMVIYNPENNSEDYNIYEFCKLIKNDVINKKSVLIFSDSKNISIKVNTALLEYNNNLNYYLLINKDSGTLEDLNNCNQTFKNKCVITSPKICYGLDVLIEYNNIYCIYKNTNKINSMTALEYHQQYSRARNCKCVNILVVSQSKFKNKYISYDKNMAEQEQKYNNYKDNYDILLKKYKLVDELCATLSIEGITINKNSIFAEIHYYKTWYDNLFNRNKVQIIELLAKESGYTIEHKKLKGKFKKISYKKAIDNFNDQLEIIGKNIYDEIEFDDNNKAVSSNIMEQIENRKKFIEFDDLTRDDLKEIITENKKFTTYLNKKYLDLDREKFDTVVINIAKNEIPQLAKDNKLLNKIKILFELEELLQVKRYDINKIVISDDIVKTLKSSINKICPLFDGKIGHNIAKSRLINSINKITNTNRLQKFMADCYNNLGNIIIVNKKRIFTRTDKKINATTIYSFS